MKTFRCDICNKLTNKAFQIKFILENDEYLGDFICKKCLIRKVLLDLIEDVEKLY